MTDRTSARIDSDRLRALFEGIQAFGRQGATDDAERPAFGEADMAARRWFAEQMSDAGLRVSRDDAGNLLGRWGADSGAAVVLGAHLDGGPSDAFDGALAASLALESIRTLKEAEDGSPKCSIELVVFADGAGRFADRLGVRAFAGAPQIEDLSAASDVDGVTLEDAMAGADLNVALIETAARSGEAIRAFVDLHVDDTGALSREGNAVGIVEQVTGESVRRVRLTATGGHTGTQSPDALAGMCEIGATLSSIMRIVGSEASRMTMGEVDVAANRGPGVSKEVAFSLYLSDPDERTMQSLGAAFIALVERVANARGLDMAIEEKVWEQPKALDGEIAGIVEAEAQRLDLTATRMVVAGRKAQIMQARGPSGLIVFTPADGDPGAGKVNWDALERVANLHLATLVRLAETGTSLAAPTPLSPVPADEEAMHAEMAEAAEEPQTVTEPEPEPVAFSAASIAAAQEAMVAEFGEAGSDDTSSEETGEEDASVEDPADDAIFDAQESELEAALDSELAEELAAEPDEDPGEEEALPVPSVAHQQDVELERAETVALADEPTSSVIDAPETFETAEAPSDPAVDMGSKETDQPEADGAVVQDVDIPRSSDDDTAPRKNDEDTEEDIDFDFELDDFMLDDNERREDK
ncbi:hypothetical protein [Pararhizobium mangrovi]|uniref:Zn-dependent hydrolase n=1 Tax=Pararhizobium mangrovi TaxID=2590452 RepID=A0A506UGN4_9HYPH|nr:hypothetical protein [Pararhizobium mangrovi]TPW31257.1 hypothetical protein FJU11_03400 [Pararhizobium mangrovi]